MSVSLTNALPLQDVLDDFTFSGEYDNIVDFSEIDVSINAEGNYTVQFLFSIDKISIITSSTEVFTYTGGSFYNYKLTPQCRYFKLSFLATSNIDDLTIQTIYKSNILYKPSGTGADVNITNAFLPVSQYGVWDVSIPITKESASIWNNAVVGAGDISTNYADAHDSNNQSVSIFGHSSNPTTITIRASNDNINYYYTQYTYNVLEDSDFGFALTLPFKYLKLSSSAATTISASVCYC
jgi:hypothetical protein